MQITNEARDMLKQVFADKSVNSIRVYFAGYGWGRPQVGLALDEPEKDDKVVTINDIQVAIDEMIEDHIEGLILGLNEERTAFVLVGNESDCC